MGFFNVYAIKYATREAKANEHFFGHKDPHEDYSMPMDYYIWVAKSKELTIVIDVGFNESTAEKRNRTFIKCPVSTLSDIGIDPSSVDYVIITHLHYDHIGNLEMFPNAKFIIQEKEMSFWTGKYASKLNFKGHVEVEDILHLVDQNFKGRLLFVNGHEEILPGITVFLAGGHSPGLQMVSIHTEHGDVLLASDVTHFYRNLSEDRPFSIITNLPEMYDAFELIRKLAKNSYCVIPGHDPKVIDKYEAPFPDLNKIVVKIAPKEILK